jgi:hypothetical protein
MLIDATRMAGPLVAVRSTPQVSRHEVVALRRLGSGRTAVRSVRRAALPKFVSSTSNAARSASIFS